MKSLRLVLRYRVPHRLVRLVRRRPVQCRVGDLLHLAEVLHLVVDVLHLADVLHPGVDVVVPRRIVKQPDWLPTRLTPEPSPNYDVSDSRYPQRGALWTSLIWTTSHFHRVCVRRNDSAT